MATTRFRVLDAMPAPHGGYILQLRLQEGDPPALRTLKSATLEASGPGGEHARAEVAGFALFGGKPSAERFARTGRIDLHVTGDGADAIATRWDVKIA